MKQYKLIIKDDFMNDLDNLLHSMAKSGWRLHSSAQSRFPVNINGIERIKHEVVIILEK